MYTHCGSANAPRAKASVRTPRSIRDPEAACARLTYSSRPCPTPSHSPGRLSSHCITPRPAYIYIARPDLGRASLPGLPSLPVSPLAGMRGVSPVPPPASAHELELKLESQARLINRSAPQRRSACSNAAGLELISSAYTPYARPGTAAFPSACPLSLPTPRADSEPPTHSPAKPETRAAHAPPSRPEQGAYSPTIRTYARTHARARAEALGCPAPSGDTYQRA
ncbi:hypothetical protein HYPSUDRAFT_201039 [Hypholoma sublateritium FD-334 SS-4]|uniref:Uncharacterized protein n=1 Tax=Hypholoma sublateritium (strain FD-334 SS-4) TaxID=945553 RepID=A0A0D2PWP3_HYPSF|nr:hypothetical protein HYPSUDRAFT_201039 [Hypholoma sublateritium FD-334 SS-4]